MTTDHDDTASSATDHAITELQLHGYRPFQDEPDSRPLPEGRLIAGAVADIFDALIVSLRDTRLEPDLDDLLWSTVHLFHRATARIERELDGNEQAQRQSQRDQDGSEIRSVELERLLAEGLTLVERRNVMEYFRDQAAEHFARHTGSHWQPRSGSKVSHRTMTAALIDSRDFIAARRRAETEVMLPPGRKIAFKPDWAKGKAAPFKRNDAILEAMPIGVLVTTGSGIQANLSDKARRLGIPVWQIGKDGA